MLHLLRSSLLSASVLPTVALAQSYNTDLLSIAGGGIFNSKVLYAVSPTGVVTPLHAFPLLLHPETLVHHVDNRSLVLNYTNPFAVVTFDPTTLQATSVLHAGPPLRDILSLRPYHTGDYLAAEGLSSSSIQLVRADGSGTSTVFGPGTERIEAVDQDLFTGKVLAGMSTNTGPSLIRIDPMTGNFVTLDPNPRQVTSLVQDHRDGAVYYGTRENAIFRWHPAVGVTPFLPAGPPAGSDPTSLTFDRDVGNGILVVGNTHRIVRIDFAPGGTPVVVAVHDQLPPAPVAAMDLAFRHGRNLSSRRLGPGNRWSFGLSFPGEPGNGYVLAFSLTGFTPGLPIGSRAVPLVPDAVFVASITGGLVGLLQNGIGVLDGGGRATAALDLSVFGSLAGLKLWAAVATLDPTAPAGIRTLSKPIVVVLD
jgi:hypothetical protein